MKTTEKVQRKKRTDLASLLHLLDTDYDKKQFSKVFKTVFGKKAKSHMDCFNLYASLQKSYKTVHTPHLPIDNETEEDELEETKFKTELCLDNYKAITKFVLIELSDEDYTLLLDYYKKEKPVFFND